MSLLAPQTKEEGKFQYCNYGYDKTKFKSFDDCMTNYNKVFFTPTTTDLTPINKFEVTCKDGTKDVSNGKNPPCTKNGGVKQNAPLQVPQIAKQTFLEKNSWKLIAVGVPVGFYAFSKYQKYDNKKTLKVTIIGSVVVLGAMVLNGFSGAWTGTTFMDNTFGKQKYW